MSALASESSISCKSCFHLGGTVAGSGCLTNWLPEKRMSDKLLLLLCCLEDKTSTCMWSVPEAP